MILIGIDPGVKTGYATASGGKLLTVDSYSAVEAEKKVLDIAECSAVKLYIEDARKRKWFGENEEAVQAKKQGAGSVKRDSKRWQEFCEFYKLDFEMIAPSNNKTNVDASRFKSISGFQGRTNQHGRDAAMLIHGRKPKKQKRAGCWNPSSWGCDCPACGGNNK